MKSQEFLNFDKKTVIVCGGSNGIGYGVAKMFVQLGANVSITGTSDISNYENDYSDMNFHQLDISSESQVENFAAKFDHIDVLVNCIGTVLYKKREFERQGFEDIIMVNLTGAMQLYMAFYPLLEKSQGNIVSLDSVVSIRPAINNPAYSASKAGLVQLTKTLARKWGRNGVRVNTVAPGAVPTKLTDKQFTPENEAAFAKSCPVGRYGRPEDIAGAVVYLASPLASYVTGHQLVVDGGITI